MTVTEFLQLVDQLVFEQTEKHLSDLQKKVVLGILQGKTYNQIAQDFGYDSENYIGNICRDLYKILSDKLGEDINKHNFCWTIERVINSQVIWGKNKVKNNINLCPHNQTTNNHQPVNTEKQNNIYHDLKLAPKIINFYNRENELKTLYNWIFNQNTPLISVLGLTLTENIKFRLNELFNRLSSVEIKILLQLSKFDQPISREELGEGLEIASNEISIGLQSLNKRYLLIKIEGEKVLFKLEEVLREYVNKYYQN